MTMGKELTTKGSAGLPAHLRTAVVARQAAKEFSGGVQSGFPIISYRGKTWRVRQGGDEQVYTDDDGDAVQAVNLVLIRSNENLSKTYYKGKYKEGDNSKPTCWSAGGIRPDPNVPEPVSSTCQGCPMNVWGSRVSDEGKKQKACADVRRMAVIMEHELEAIVAGEKSIDDALVMLLRVPASSLNPLKDYVEKKLLPKGGLLPFMLVSRLGFDTDAAYPRFTFKAARFLNEEEFGTVQELRESDIVKRIINEAAEHDDGGPTGEVGEAASSDRAVKAEATKPAPPKSSVEETSFSEPADDDDDEDEIALPPPSPAKKRAAAVEEEAADSGEEDEEDEIPAAPPPRKKPAKPAAPVEADEEPAPPKKSSKKSASKSTSAKSPSGADDIDSMLDSILG
jgi:hypothetical protein